MCPSRSRWPQLALAAAACAVISLAGCTSEPRGQGVAAAQLLVGDHWQYLVTDNLRRGVQAQLDAEVIAVSGRVARIRFASADANGRTEWVDEVDGEGGLRAGSLWREQPRAFDPPAQLLAFPLDLGKTWRQVINTVRTDTGLPDQILIYGRVEGRDTTTVPAGTFETVYVYRIAQLDDQEPWRNRTVLSVGIWYSPAVKASVREKREAAYTEKGGPDPATVRTESSVLELVSFRPGGR